MPTPSRSQLNTDGCEPDVDKDKYLEDGMVINMVKGTKVTLTVDGKTNDVATKAKTVEDFLKEQKVTLGADDEVSEKLTAEIKDGMKIVVKRVEYKTEEKTEKIEYKTVEKESDSLEAGKEEVTQEGKDGEKTVTYKVKYVDGKEDSREKVEEKVTKEAVDKVVTRGTKAESSQQEQPQQSQQQEQPQQSQQEQPAGKTVVSKENFPDCDGSGHGYYEIHYSDGSVEYQQY